MRASVHGAREFLARKTLVALKRSTLRTLLEPEGSLPPVLPVGSYSHNKSEQRITIKSGGTIDYFGLDHPEAIASTGYTGGGCDELVEFTEDDYAMLRGRARVRVRGVPRQIYSACNPGPPSHWIAERFGLALGHAGADGCEAIRTTSFDNDFLPRDYLDDLDTFVGLRRRRYVLGEWAGSDGLVYDAWDRDANVIAHHAEPARVIICVDYGYSHPFAALRLHVDSDGRCHVAREVYGRHMQRDAQVSAVRGLGGADAECVVYDSSAAELGDAMRQAGLPARPADKRSGSVLDGIARVQQRLARAGDGLPRLTVDPSCTETIREFETYEWAMDRSTGTRKDVPIKSHDHAMDALRYGVAYVDRGEVDVAVYTPGGPAESGRVTVDPREDLDWGWDG
jgi:PBSX family phage terminase large subunit